MPTALEVPAVDAPRPPLWRIRDRRTFSALRRHGRRARRGALAVTWLAPTDASPPQAAFVVGRSAGGAVARNRVRRRLRAALRELQAADRLPGGTYLVSGTIQVADLPWTELVELVGSAVDEVTP
jgi:ribonuclease P protein component